MTFSGSAAAINAALEGLVFTPNADYAGAAALDVQTSDLGTAAVVGRSRRPAPLRSPSARVNDAPALMVPGAQAMIEDVPLQFQSPMAMPSASATSTPGRRDAAQLDRESRQFDPGTSAV
jgi:hypothetical protein